MSCAAEQQHTPQSCPRSAQFNSEVDLWRSLWVQAAHCSVMLKAGTFTSCFETATACLLQDALSSSLQYQHVAQDLAGVPRQGALAGARRRRPVPSALGLPVRERVLPERDGPCRGHQRAVGCRADCQGKLEPDRSASGRCIAPERLRVHSNSWPSARWRQHISHLTTASLRLGIHIGTRLGIAENEFVRSPSRPGQCKATRLLASGRSGCWKEEGRECARSL